MANIQHENIPEAQLHEPKGASTASSGQVYFSDGAGSGSWQLPTVELTNIIEVTSLADFPAPVGNVIELEAGIGYFISGSVDIEANSINFGSVGSALIGFNRATDSLVGTSAGPLITSLNRSVPITGLSLSNLGTGPLFDLVGSGSELVLLDKVAFSQATSLGSVSNFNNFIMDNCGIDRGSVGLTTSGLLFIGSFGEIVLRDSFFTNWTGTLLDLGTSLTNFFTTQGSRFVGDLTNTAISGLPLGGNIAAIGLGSLASSVFAAMTTPLIGIDHADVGWFFNAVIGVQESGFVGYTSMAGNTIDTAISAANTWTKVAGITVPSTANERFNQTADNELETASLLDRPVTINVSLSAGKVGGGNRVLEFTVFKDSGSGFVQLDPNVVALLETDDKPRGASLVAVDTASPGDKYSVYCQNTTDSSNIEVPTMQFDIRG